MLFEYKSDEVREEVRRLRAQGLLASWPNPDKREGYIPTPVEVTLIMQARNNIAKGNDPATPLDCLQERIDVMMEKVESFKRSRVLEALLDVMGTSLGDIEELRASSKFARAMLPERKKRGTVFQV